MTSVKYVADEEVEDEVIYQEIPAASVKQKLSRNQIIKGAVIASAAICFVVGLIVVFWYIAVHVPESLPPEADVPEKIVQLCPPHVDTNIGARGEIECSMPTDASFMKFSHHINESIVLEIAEIVMLNETEENRNGSDYNVVINSELDRDVEIIVQDKTEGRKVILVIKENRLDYTGRYSVSLPRNNLSVIYNVRVPGLLNKCRNTMRTVIRNTSPIRIPYTLLVIDKADIVIKKLNKEINDIVLFEINLDSQTVDDKTVYSRDNDSNVALRLQQQKADKGRVDATLIIYRPNCKYAGQYEMVFNASYCVSSICNTTQSACLTTYVIESEPKVAKMTTFYGGTIEGTPVNMTCEAETGCFDVPVRLQKQKPGDSEFFDWGGWAIDKIQRHQSDLNGTFKYQVNYAFEGYQITRGLDDSMLRCNFEIDEKAKTESGFNFHVLPRISREDYSSKLYEIYPVPQDFCDNKDQECNYCHPSCDKAKQGFYITCLTQPYERPCFDQSDPASRSYIFGKRKYDACDGKCDLNKVFQTDHEWNTYRQVKSTKKQTWCSCDSEDFY